MHDHLYAFIRQALSLHPDVEAFAGDPYGLPATAVTQAGAAVDVTAPPVYRGSAHVHAQLDGTVTVTGARSREIRAGLRSDDEIVSAIGAVLASELWAGFDALQNTIRLADADRRQETGDVDESC